MSDYSKDLHILLLCLDMDPTNAPGDRFSGGGHLYILETLQLLAQKNIPTLAFTYWLDKQKPQMEKFGESVTLVRFQVDLTAAVFQQYQVEKIVRDISEITRKLNFQPTIIHSIYWSSGFVACHLKKTFPCLLLHTVISLGKVKHQTTGISGRCALTRESCEQDIFETASMIFAVCQQEKVNLLRLYSNIPEDRIMIIGRGIDPQLFNTFPNKKDDRLQSALSFHQPGCLLFVGRLVVDKGYPFLLCVYDQLLRDNPDHCPPLWIVGGTDNEVQIARETSINTSSLKRAEQVGQIRWWGHIPRVELPAYYRRALITCLPSKYDAGSRVLLESLACGTPVITTPTGYVGELVIDQKNGLIVDYGDTDGWRLGLHQIINNEPFRQFLASQAQQALWPYFSMDSFRERQWHFYQLIAQRVNHD